MTNLEDFLEPLGTVQRNLEVPGEPKFVDLWFTPAPESSASVYALGLLNRLVASPCLLEPFRNSPSRQEIRSCLLKLFWIQEDQRRRVEQEGSAEAELPKLWVLAATTTRPVIAEFGGQVRTDWLPGIYFLSEGFKAAIVAIDQLPITSHTLWLRILGRDQTQQQAVAEVLDLSLDDPRRSSTLQLLVNWKISLDVTGEID